MRSREGTVGLVGRGGREGRRFRVGVMGFRVDRGLFILWFCDSGYLSGFIVILCLDE